MSDTPDLLRGELLIYTSTTGKVHVEVAFGDGKSYLTNFKLTSPRPPHKSRRQP